MKIKKVIKNIKKVIKSFLLIFFLLLLFLSIYVNISFNNISFEQLLYSIIYSHGTSFSAISQGVFFVAMGIISSIIIILLIKKIIRKINVQIYFTLQVVTKRMTINIIKMINTIIFIGFIISSTIVSVKLLNIDDYIKSQLISSKLFEEYYVNPKEVNLKFPNKKQNLIYIYVESLEMTNASVENGGALKKSYIPNLEKLALENINFSNTSKLGGALPVYGTEWTAAAMISQSSGVLLKVSIDANSYGGYGESLPGVYSLGDVLKDNGYKNYLMIGSEATFGGRKDYFTYHGKYAIYDYDYAVKKKLIDEDYYVWWGYEDKKLYEFAKEKLLDISKNDEPFNFTMLTADTHFVDGYVDDSCSRPFDSNYANSFACTDTMLYEFINWIKKQDFYENTTVIITGDHLTMQKNFYNDIDNNYDRNIYNVFINSKSDPINEKNRLFSSFDMYPTTLASLGVEIEGNKLGLGVNLFSNEETLIEKLGYDYLNEELNKKSFFYDNNLLGDTYYKMQEELEKEKQENGSDEIEEKE